MTAQMLNGGNSPLLMTAESEGMKLRKVDRFRFVHIGMHQMQREIYLQCRQCSPNYA